MPTYEFRCRTCGSTFDVARPMAESNEPAPCPGGHDDTVKLLTTVGMTGRAAGTAAPAAGGGCCGGACGCG
ncbi:zinc ribbon domain-containing protein [Phytoactinopolyspora alkaliphila]|uniref:Zinc ribbon domain-containing protein n=1 Tax=Phytoactinopolyspora alkaliphila TaxID=1783498 RepID=A0A6N9YL30_9ACTN|nr:zinc ribbon domain-containing protein [Phytoactinopolyspora alkaliphila]